MLNYVQEKKLQLLVIWDLFAGQISCSACWALKKFYNLGALLYMPLAMSVLKAQLCTTHYVLMHFICIWLHIL